LKAPVAILAVALALASCAHYIPPPTYRYPHDRMPAGILEGIMRAESEGYRWAIGDDGHSKGPYQINERWHAYYARKYGEYGPFNLVQARHVASLILRDNYRQLGVWDWSISAYRWGVAGFRRHGLDAAYLRKVKGKR
jgi:hypothetical protein